MNFANDLDLKRSYISKGEHDLASAFLVPALKGTKRYMRSVGFFSSGVFEAIMDGIIALARNGGTIQIVASPRLSEDDIAAINAGYKEQGSIVNAAFSRDFLDAISLFDDDKLQLLATLVARGILDIKIAVVDSSGAYHDKLGILEDFEGNKIVFYGSANSSLNGYQNNYEKIRVVRSWISGEVDSVNDELEEFASLWEATNEFVKVYSFRDSARKCILQIIEQRQSGMSGGGKSAPIKLRDYQERAIQSWVDNGYHGFYVMATGTGKTWTAIYSSKELLKGHLATIVICAPYKHLVKQWMYDVEKAYSDARIILVSSENPMWEQQLTQAIISKKYNKDEQIIVISTIASFQMPRFSATIQKDKSEKLLIVDEAHRFTNRPDSIKEQYAYLLGLSATPHSGASAQKGKELLAFFGGQVFNLPIEEALNRKYLVPYYYRPIFVNATADEEQQFQYYSRRILSCFNKAGICINLDLLVKSLRSRLRVISMANEKQEKLNDFIDTVLAHDTNHFIVYCGDGRLFDNDVGAEIRHIQSVKKALYEHDVKASQFTATESMEDRMQLVDAFNKGEISALAAIRCLDEGIDIPSIKSALILSSNDDYREFVQRRGRILRRYDRKEDATIYDIVVLPSHDTSAWAKIELRRFLEYAKLSKNWPELEPVLESLLQQYDLSIDDIDVYDYEDVEEETDE